MTKRKFESVEEYRARKRVASATWRVKNPGYSQRYRATHMEQHREHTRRFKLKNPDYHYKHTFGMTQGQYATLCDAQNGVCAICKQPETTIRRGKIARLAVDHCHTTGRIRGLLCAKCNIALGLFRDSTQLLAAAMEYLKRNEASK